MYADFLSVNKDTSVEWEEIKHIIISYINDHYSKGNKSIINLSKNFEKKKDYNELEKKNFQCLRNKSKTSRSERWRGYNFPKI